jgi:IS30 family transposase
MRAPSKSTSDHRKPRTSPRRILAAHARLALLVEENLGLWWSPQQIAGWLRETYPSDPEMWVSHETIFLSLFVQSRGALKHELTKCLRTRRAMRRPHQETGSHR